MAKKFNEIGKTYLFYLRKEDWNDTKYFRNNYNTYK